MTIESTYKREFETLPESAINTAVLKSVLFSPQDRIELSSTLITEEFASLCPLSGLPDFAKLTISYYPKDRIAEMKSLKLYIASYHRVGIFMEKACQRIALDLGNLLNPESLSVEMRFNARGGWVNNVQAEWQAT